MSPASPRRVFVSAGEASGDLHAAHLVEALKLRWPNTEFVGFGGPQLAKAGVELREDLVETSVMGFLPVLLSIGSILKTVARFEQELRADPPDLFLPVDYPGLHLNLSYLARRHQVPVVSYIVPQVWAWAPWRLRRVARRSDRMLVILPFEEEIYSAVHRDVHFVGNPVFDHLSKIETDLPEPNRSRDRKTLAILPGSRRQEVRGNLPSQLRVARRVLAEDPSFEIVVSVQREALRPMVEEAMRTESVVARLELGAPHALQSRAEIALVCSGTATLEQAWFGTPMVVQYPASEIERSLYESFSVAPHFALVNLFAGREIVPEVLFTPGEEESLCRAAFSLLDESRRSRIRSELAELREGRFHGGAAEKSAERVVEFWRNRGS